MSVIKDGIIYIFLMLAGLAYRLMSGIANLFYEISFVDLVSNETVSAIYQRVGLILGLFMLFKLTFSFIQMIIDPDMITDREKGVENIIKRVFIVVIMLGITPSLFSAAYKIQDAVLDKNDNLIQKIVLGDDSHNDDFGNEFSATLFSSFIEDEYNRDYFRKALIDSGSNYTGEGDTTTISKTAGEKRNQASSNPSSIVGDIDPVDSNTITYSSAYEYIDSIGIAFLALVVGFFVCWIFLNYTLALALRSVQLLFLQLIAPIPIMSYVSSKKDTAFSGWIKQCLTTYLDVFIRMFILEMVILLVQIVTSIDFDFTDNLGWWSGLILRIIIIIGIVLFLKKAPELIREMFPGMNSKAAIDLSFGKGTGVGKAAAGALGLGMGALLGGGARAIGRVRNDLARRNKLNALADMESNEEKAGKLREKAGMINKRRIAGSAVSGLFAGAGSGALTGVRSGYNGKFYSGMGDVIKRQKATNEAYNEWRNDAGEEAKTVDRWKSKVQQTMGILTDYQKIQKEIGSLEYSSQGLKANAAYGTDLNDAQKKMEDRAENKILKGEVHSILDANTLNKKNKDDLVLINNVKTLLGIDLTSRETLGHYETSQIVGMAKSKAEMLNSEYDAKIQSVVEKLNAKSAAASNVTDVEGKKQLQSEINLLQTELTNLQNEAASEVQKATSMSNAILKSATRNTITQTISNNPGADDKVLSSLIEDYKNKFKIASKAENISSMGLDEESVKELQKIAQDPSSISSFEIIDDIKVKYKNAADELIRKAQEIDDQIAKLKIKAEEYKPHDDYNGGSK